MSRWYQNVLSGKQVEVKTLDEDDFYVENAANWARIPKPPEAEGPPPAQPVAPPMKKRAGKR